MPKYIIAKLLGKTIIKRNRGENRKLITLGHLGVDVFEVEAGSKEKALKKGLNLFPAEFEKKVTTVGLTSSVKSVGK